MGSGNIDQLSETKPPVDIERYGIAAWNHTKNHLQSEGSKRIRERKPDELARNPVSFARHVHATRGPGKSFVPDHAYNIGVHDSRERAEVRTPVQADAIFEPFMKDQRRCRCKKFAHSERLAVRFSRECFAVESLLAAAFNFPAIGHRHTGKTLV